MPQMVFLGNLRLGSRAKFGRVECGFRACAGRAKKKTHRPKSGLRNGTKSGYTLRQPSRWMRSYREP